MPEAGASMLPDPSRARLWAAESELEWSGPVARRRRALQVDPWGRAATANEAASSRRTIQITGRGAERDLPVRSASGGTRYPGRPRQAGSDTSSLMPRRASARPRGAPDRVALWAVLLGIVLLLVAAASSHAAAFHP